MPLLLDQNKINPPILPPKKIFGGKIVFRLLPILFSGAFLSSLALADEASPIQVKTVDYQFKPQIYEDVIKDRETELWARIYYPTTQKTNGQIALDKVPVVAIMHGNHPTCGTSDFPRKDNSCEYTTKHQCSGDYQVIKNHLGFEYLAKELAKSGMLVISINANLGISCGEGQENDPGLTLARGRLILKHLQLLSDWNRGIKIDGELAPILLHKLDLDRVGLIGHSRGGEGVRAALNIYKDAQEQWYSKIGPMKMKAIFEMTPIDGEAGRILNPENVAWNVLLSACDGDVPHLEGIKVFDRMSLQTSETQHFPKSALLTWGTNHNFYNTEWQTSDSMSCGNHLPIFPLYPGSSLQRKIAIESAVPFFMNYLGTSEKLDLVDFFDPLKPMKPSLSGITTIERSYASLSNVFDGSAFPLEDFFLTPGRRSLPELSEVDQKSVVIPEHEVTVVGSQLSWLHGSANTYAQFNWNDDEFALDFPKTGYFEMRISVGDQKTPEIFDFSIQMAGKNQQYSKSVKVSKYITFLGPAASHSLLQTLRIPVSDFQGITEIKGVRFIFDGTTSGKIYVNALYLREAESETAKQTQLFSLNLPKLAKLVNSLSPISSANAEEAVTGLNGVTQFYLTPLFATNRDAENQKIIQQAQSSARQFQGQFRGLSSRVLDSKSSQLSNRLAFYSLVPFEAKGSLLVLSVGQKLFKVSGYDASGDLGILNFYLSDQEKASLRVGEPMRIFYLSAPQGNVWSIGNWPGQ